MIDIEREKERIKLLSCIRDRTIGDFHVGTMVSFIRNKMMISGVVTKKEDNGGGVYTNICPSLWIQGDNGICYIHVSVYDVEMI